MAKEALTLTENALQLKDKNIYHLEVSRRGDVAFVNNEARFFDLPVGYVDTDNATAVDLQALSELQSGPPQSDVSITIPLHTGNDHYPQVKERPMYKEFVGEVGIELFIDEKNLQIGVGTQIEYPVAKTESEVVGTPRLTRAGLDSPKLALLKAQGGVTLSENIRLFEPLITGNIRFHAKIDKGGIPEGSTSFFNLAETGDSVGQAALGLVITEAMKVENVSRPISEAVTYYLTKQPQNGVRGNLAQVVRDIKNASYTLHIEGRAGNETWSNSVDSNGPLEVIAAPRDNFSTVPSRGYWFPALHVDVPVNSTLPIKIDPAINRIEFLTDRFGHLLDASQVAESDIPRANRKTINLRETKPNSQRLLFDNHQVQVEVIEHAERHPSRQISDLGLEKTAPLMSAWYKTVAAAISYPGNPYAGTAMEALVVGALTMKGL